jgi:hypothetical protein
MYLELVSPLVCISTKDGGKMTGSGIVTATRFEKQIRNDVSAMYWVTYILSARHVISQAQREAGVVMVSRPIFVNGTRTGYEKARARIVRISDNYDLALLAVEADTKPFVAEAVPIFVESLHDGVPLKLCSSPQGKQGMFSDGTYVSGSRVFFFKEDDKEKSFVTKMFTTCVTDPGSSGGGFFMKSKGYLCTGILTHTTKMTSNGFGLTGAEIKDFAVREKLEHAFQFTDSNEAMLSIATSK